MSRTFRIRHRKQLAVARLPVMSPSKIDFLANEMLTQKDLYEAYDRRMRKASYNEPPPQIPDVRDSSWAAIVQYCEKCEA
jgi:hypothetical protein